MECFDDAHVCTYTPPKMNWSAHTFSVQYCMLHIRSTEHNIVSNVHCKKMNVLITDSLKDCLVPTLFSVLASSIMLFLALQFKYIWVAPSKTGRETLGIPWRRQE